MTDVLIGVDKGTTTTKTTAVDAVTGRVVGSGLRATPVRSAAAGRHEEDLETTWVAVAGTIRDAVAGLGRDDRVIGVGVCGHMGGLWALDADRQPVGPAIGWPDSRAVDLLDEWGASGLMPRLFDIGGNALMAGMPAVLLAWMSRHEPVQLSRISTVFFAKDYVNFRLTGEIFTDESDLSLLPCDIRNRTYSQELFALMGIPGAESLFPAAVLASDAVAGKVTAEASAVTGLPVGTPVVAGLGDAVANALGIGAAEPGQAATVIGTSFMNLVTTDTAVLDPAGVGFSALMPAGRWQRMLCNTGGGTLGLDWGLRTLCGGEARRIAAGERTLGDYLESEVAAVEPLAGGVTFLPYLSTAGATAPFVDPWARASFVGLTPATTSHQMLRAVLEGTAFSMKECYAGMPVDITEIRVTGGGARSALWRGICADVMGTDLQVPLVEQSGATGAALAAGVGTGYYASYADGIAALVHEGPMQQHDPSRTALYQRGYEAYQAQCAAFAPLWRARAEFLRSERRSS